MVNLYPEFYNDVFGPIMQPGSSSHMAGPCRIGYLCNSLLGENVKDITVLLDNEGSFAGTFGHMNEDLGMLNGAAGFMPDYKDFFSIKENLQKAGINYTFHFGSMKESDHLNAVKFVLTGESGKKATLVANSTGGGMIETVFVNDYAFCGRGDTYVLFVYDPENSVSEKAVCEIVEKNTVVLEKGVGAGKIQGRVFWFKLEDALSDEAKQMLSGYSYDLMYPVLPVLTTRSKKPQLFDSMQTWRALAKEQNKSMVQVAIDYEVAASGWTEEEVVGYMKNTVQANMYRRVHAFHEEELEWIHTPFDKNFNDMWTATESMNLVTGALFKSVYYMNGARLNLKGVCNVPGPMGSGGGFIYAILSALQDEKGFSEDELLNALFIAAGVGSICYTRSFPTGEVTGCAGEMGCCTAMASAAAVQLLGGTPEQMESAATFSLQAAIGWPCDPVPGSGGVACNTRAMYAAIMSIVYAQFAMSGADAVIPFHEEVDLMDKMGKSLSPDLLCTSRGGHCATPTGRKCMECFQAYRKTL